jgi:hypothetical protein
VRLGVSWGYLGLPLIPANPVYTLLGATWGYLGLLGATWGYL